MVELGFDKNFYWNAVGIIVLVSQLGLSCCAWQLSVYTLMQSTVRAGGCLVVQCPWQGSVWIFMQSTIRPGGWLVVQCPWQVLVWILMQSTIRAGGCSVVHGNPRTGLHSWVQLGLEAPTRRRSGTVFVIFLWRLLTANLSVYMSVCVSVYMSVNITSK